MMRSKFLTILLCLSAWICYAQKIIYFNEDWEVISDKENASFYRETTKEKNLFHIKDYYRNGTLQMDAFSSNDDPNNEMFEGEVKWYHENGKLSQKAQYKNGKQIGTYQTYDRLGRISSDFIYDEERPTGKSFEYKNMGETDTLSFQDYNMERTYVKGRMTKEIHYDESINGIRFESYFDEISASREVFYDKNGKKIGELKYKEGEPTGTEIDYYHNPMEIKTLVEHKDNKIVKSIDYYRGGIKQSEMQATAKGEFRTFFDRTGKKIGELKTSNDPEDGYMQEGTDIQFHENGTIASKTALWEGLILKEEFFDETGKPEAVINRDQDGIVSEILRYRNGKGVSRMIYRDGEPYNGKDIQNHLETEYRNGKLFSQKSFNINSGSSERMLVSELNEINGNYVSNIFDLKGQQVYKVQALTTDQVEDNDFITGTVTTFENGNPKYIAEVENGFLTKGEITLYFEDYISMWRTEKDGWVTINFYQNGELIKTVKEKQTFVVEDLYYDYESAITFGALQRAINFKN